MNDAPPSTDVSDTRDVRVQKYGGSSLADLDRLEDVADKIVETRRAGDDVVAVVSAMGDTTDALLEKAETLAPDPSRRELDMLLSVGERIAMSLISVAIQERGEDAISLTGSQSGIITTHNHADARIMDMRPFRVQDELAMGKIVIVAGYQGVSYRREVTTLGRGGSDTTAVALAAALDAETCEFYSDVDGIYSADPETVLSADQLLELSHEEMLEMSRSGAKVLNEEAVEFARRSDIALYAKKTEAPDERGTIVRTGEFEERVREAESSTPAVAVSHIERGLWIRADASRSEIADEVDDHRSLVFDWHARRGGSIFLELDDLYGVDTWIEQLESIGEDVCCRRVGLVSVVGEGMGRRPRWPQRGRETLQEADVSVLESGVEADRLSWLVETPDVERGVRALHRTFIE